MSDYFCTSCFKSKPEDEMQDITMPAFCNRCFYQLPHNNQTSSNQSYVSTRNDVDADNKDKAIKYALSLGKKIYCLEDKDMVEINKLAKFPYKKASFAQIVYKYKKDLQILNKK